MQIFGIGMDIVEVARIAQAIERRGELFLSRLFTPAEREYCERQTRPALHFAARFSAKEAVSKALGTGIGGQAGWLDLEVTREPSGAPKIFLTGAAAQFAESHGISAIQISLTHARDYAAASAIAIADGGNSSIG